jgi:N-acyl-D-aspartate/D-glutamate deacylase
MHDVVIKGGLVVDGTGARGALADVAIRDGRIVEVGVVAGPARQVIDAGGAIVTPGFIDIHTHYDGQFLWDDEMEPSFSNGVTTAIAGNCGVGFAPVRPGESKALVDIMEGVEDIPGIVIDEGLDWSWETFPQYMDKLAQRRFTMDVATHFAHAPLRVYVMGERGLRDEPATDDDIARMQKLVREAMEAGAVGFSAARILEHRTVKGDIIPGTQAADRELLGLARALGESGHGVFQLVPLGAAGDVAGMITPTDERLEEHARVVRIAKACRRPVTYALHAHHHAPDEWRLMMDETRKARAEGLDIRAQVPPRGLGLMLSLDGYHIFRARPSYAAIAHLPRAERAAALRDPARRAAILSEPDTALEGLDLRAARLAVGVKAKLAKYFVMEPPADYEPEADKRLDVIAKATGRTEEEVLYDLLSEGDGAKMAVDFHMHFTDGTLDAAREMLLDPATVSGLGDGGAHMPMICDGASTTFHLWFWSRDRKRGPKLPLELMVRRLTGDPASLYGMNDRGVIAPGKRADLNVIDFGALTNEMPHMVFDLPKGGARLMQKGTGYLATLVNGVVTRRNDQDTGERPGRLVRSRAEGPVGMAAE